jgi:non-canonical (house-cleaning) NTP pyrophosphatase
MVIKVGSLNESKIASVKEALNGYAEFEDSEIAGVKTVNEIGHEIGLEPTT